MLRKQPTFPSIAVVTLALRIGATSTVRHAMLDAVFTMIMDFCGRGLLVNSIGPNSATGEFIVFAPDGPDCRHSSGCGGGLVRGIV